MRLLGEHEDPLGIVEDDATSIGQMDTIADLTQELGPQILLQGMDVPRHRGLADVELLGRAGIREAAGHREEHEQVTVVHSS